MTQTPLERAEQAIRDTMQNAGMDVEEYDLAVHNAARAVLMAIREPNADWVEKAMESEYVVSWGDYKEFWQAMIDAALEE